VSWVKRQFTSLFLLLALAGGVLAAFFVGGVGTLGAMAGLLSVIGIAARSNILLIRSYRGDDESGFLGADLVMRATRDRSGRLTFPCRRVSIDTCAQTLFLPPIPITLLFLCRRKFVPGLAFLRHSPLVGSRR